VAERSTPGFGTQYGKREVRILPLSAKRVEVGPDLGGPAGVRKAGTGLNGGRRVRINGKTDHTSAALPSLTKGQRLKVRVDGEAVDAEAIEVTQLTTDEPIKWKLIARELEPSPQS
jgi:hypothetical protein